MPPTTRDYGRARDCAVCGARIKGTPKFETMIRADDQLLKLAGRVFPICDWCEAEELWLHEFNENMIRRRIASGAYKVVDGGDGVG